MARSHPTDCCTHGVTWMYLHTPRSTWLTLTGRDAFRVLNFKCCPLSRTMGQEQAPAGPSISTSWSISSRAFLRSVALSKSKLGRYVSWGDLIRVPWNVVSNTVPTYSKTRSILPDIHPFSTILLSHYPQLLYTPAWVFIEATESSSLSPKSHP